jgi:hypothetical protein
MDDAGSGVIKLLKKLQMGMDNVLLRKISPEAIAKAHSSELFRLVQFCEIEEEIGGPKVTAEALKEEIMRLVPIFGWDGMDAAIKAKFDAAAMTIAAKLMEIKQRACRDQGSGCRGCYIQDACTQRLQQKE